VAVLAVVGINHNTAPVSVREQFAFASNDLPHALEALRQATGNGVILSTCNRTEVYVVGARGAAVRDAVFRFLSETTGANAQEHADRFYVHEHREALLHLCRVAAGIDSMVLGEAQILGQVRSAYAAAAAAKTTNAVLDRALHAAIRVGRRARSETSIGRYSMSVSSTAVSLARNIVGDLASVRVLVLSAGEAGKLTARTLAESGVARMLVASRSSERASELAAELGGTAIPFGEMPAALADSDVVISSTGATSFLIDAPMVGAAMQGRNGRPLLLIDIAVPRDVDPAAGELPNVHLYDIDSLQAVAETNLNHRRNEVGKVEALVEEEVDRFIEWWDSLGVIPTVAALRHEAEQVRQRELAKTLQRLPDLSPEDQRRIDAMTAAIVKKILHKPVSRLKEGTDGELYVEAARELFGLGDIETPGYY
jgi:glutamyl-tRNA reductase